MRPSRLRLAAVGALFAFGAAAADDESSPSNWVELRAGAAFSLRAPPGTTFAPKPGIDSFVGEFVGTDFVIGFDYGSYSNDLGRLRANPEFRTETADIDGRPAIIVTGPGGPDAWGCADRLAALYVVVSGGSDNDALVALQMDGCAESADTVGVLHEVFRSLKFSRPLE